MRRFLPAGTSVLLVAVAAAFVPLENLPSFDTPKLLVLAAGAAVLSFVAARRRAPGAAESALRDPLVLLPAVVAVAAAAAAVGAWPRGSLAGPALALACVGVARIVPAGPDGVRSTARAASLAAAGIGLYALVQVAGLDPAPWGGRRDPVATLGNRSFAAEFQAAAVPFALLLALAPATTKRDRCLGAAALVLATVHLVLAKSRIDLVAAPAGALAFAFLSLRDRGTARRLAIGAGIAGALAAALFVAAGSGAIGFLGRSDTIAVRTSVWEGSLRLFLDAPFRFGTAPFIDLFPPYRGPEEYRISLGRVVDTPHMDVLEVATTLGIVGLSAVAAWLAIAARRVLRLRGEFPWESAAIGGSAAALLVSGLASSPLTHPATALLLALAGGHLVALAPRPLALPLPRARVTDLVACAVLVAACWPGPALPAFRSESFHALAMTEKSERRAQRAIVLFDAAAAADPLAYAPRFEVGTLLLSVGERDAAVRALEAALRIRPNSADCRANLVYALRESRRGDDAERLLDASLALVPWHPLLLTARAAAASSRGDWAAARADLDRAAPLRPWDLRIRAVRAGAALSADADETSRVEALDVLAAIREGGDFLLLSQAAREFARRDPLFLAVLSARARRIAAERPDEAAALVLAPVEGLSPPDPGFFEEASKVLRTCGREDQATVLLGRALGLRARTALAAGDVDSARRLAVRAAERDPIPEHRMIEVLCLARVRDRTGTREALAAAAALGPIDPEFLRADPAFAALLPDPTLDLLLSRGRGSAPAAGGAGRGE